MSNSQKLCLEAHIDSQTEVLKTWQTPDPGIERHALRPKSFSLVRFDCGCVAVCKSDSAPEYIAHEAQILRALGDLECVPSLLCQTSNAIYTKYIEGRLLHQAIRGLGIGDCVNTGRQIVAAVAEIHKKGVVHSDIRPWNFIYGDDARLYLFDFEYAYQRSQAKKVPELLSNHHGGRLKTVTTDWCDALRSIGLAWQLSGHWLVKFALAYLPLGLHWLLRPLILVQQLGNWRRGMFSWPSPLGRDHPPSNHS